MQIREISIFRCPVKLTEPFIISLGRLEYADNVFVRIRTSNGITGMGECSPFQTIHGENADTCIAVADFLARRLIGSEVDADKCTALMDQLIYGNNSVKSAFDMALYDILSIHAGEPLYKYLGGKPGSMYTDYTISIDTPEKMASDAIKIVQRGFTVIKVKLGGEIAEDVRRIDRIRNACGYDIPLRIDANQGWSPEDAITVLKELEKYDIQHCEEPVSRKLFMSLPSIRKRTSIPLMSDESCFDHAEAERLIAINACDLINIKLGKSGINNGRKIIALAEQNGIRLQAGGFLESRLGFTAMAHLACSSENFNFFDFDTPLMFCEDPVTGGIRYGDKGMITIPDVAGIGAEVSDDILRELKSITIS